MSDLPYNPDEKTQLPLEDHEMPTRRIQRIDSDSLDETQVSASVPPDLPQVDANHDQDTESGSISQVLHNMAGMEDAVDEDGANDLSDFFSPTTDEPAPEAQETVASGPVDLPSPAHARPREAIPTRSYGDDLPYTVTASAQPPIYGGFEDRAPHDRVPPDRPPRRKRGRTARQRRESGLYLPWWSLLILLAAVAFVAALIFMGMNLLGGQFSPGGETPVIIVVTSTSTPPPTEPPALSSPTAGLIVPTITPVVQDTGGSLASPTSPSQITPAPEMLEIGIGKEVEVFDVETAGLNVREGPGTGFAVLFIVQDGSRMLVVDGPVPAGEFTWWKVRDPNTLTEGWVVADFIRVPQS